LVEYRRDYLALGLEFHIDMSLIDYCSIRYQNMPKEAQRGNMQSQNLDFIKKFGKLKIPYFDGSIIAQVVGWEKPDPTTKASAITMGHYTQCHLDVGPALGGD
jgi:hypothetical protein